MPELTTQPPYVPALTEKWDATSSLLTRANRTKIWLWGTPLNYKWLLTEIWYVLRALLWYTKTTVTERLQKP